jgi:hypothetical protein
MVRYKLGLDIDRAMPRGIRKKYDLKKIESIVTDDVFAHVTEVNHTKIKWPIKHAQVWKFLIRRDFLDGLEFIPGILYEDVPWWLTLILRHPRVTITKLPLYYYFPNFSTGILLSYKELRKNMDKCRGLRAVYELYSRAASPREFETVSREFLWQFYIHVFRATRHLDANDQNVMRAEMQGMQDAGMFDNPPFARAKKYQGRIREFIKA